MLTLALVLLLQDLTVEYDADDPNVVRYSFSVDYPEGAVLTAGIIEADVFWTEEKLERAFTRQPRVLLFEVSKRKAQARDVSWRPGWCLLRVRFADDQPREAVARWREKNQVNAEPFEFVVHLGDPRRMLAQLPDRQKKTMEMVRKAREKVEAFKKLTENEQDWKRGKTAFLGQGSNVNRYEDTVNGMIYVIEKDRGRFLPGAIQKVRQVLTTITSQEHMLKVGADGSMIPANYHKAANDPAVRGGGPMKVFTENLSKELDVAEAMAVAEVAAYGLDFLQLTLSEVLQAMGEGKLATRWPKLRIDSRTLQGYVEAARAFRGFAAVESLVNDYDQFQNWVSLEKPADELKALGEGVQKSIIEARRKWAPWRDGAVSER